MATARAALGCAAVLAACTPAMPEPEPSAPAVVASEAPAIQTAAVTPATETPVPTGARPGAAPPARDLPPKLTRGQVDKTFAHHRRYFDDLYRQRLQVNPRLSGTIVIRFVINPDGTVQPAQLLNSTLRDPQFDRIVLEQVDRMYFPPAAGPTRVDDYPLQFSGRTKP